MEPKGVRRVLLQAKAIGNVMDASTWCRMGTSFVTDVGISLRSWFRAQMPANRREEAKGLEEKNGFAKNIGGSFPEKQIAAELASKSKELEVAKLQVAEARKATKAAEAKAAANNAASTGAPALAPAPSNRPQQPDEVQSAFARLQAMRDIPECVRDTFGEGGYQRQVDALETELNAARSAARGSKSLKDQLPGKEAFVKRMEKKAATADAASIALQGKLVALKAEIEEQSQAAARANAEYKIAKTELATLSAKYHAELTLGVAADAAVPSSTQQVTLGVNVAHILQGLCKIVEPAQILTACGGDQQVADNFAAQTMELLADAARQVPPPAANESLQREFEERLQALRKVEEEVMAVDSDDESQAPSEAGAETREAKAARRRANKGKRREALASLRAVTSKFAKA